MYIEKIKQHQLQHGDILHCRGSRIISKLIKFFTGSEYSHTALFVKVNGRGYVVDAQSNGLNLKSFETWQGYYDYSFDIHRRRNISDKINDHMNKAIEENMGVNSYDFASLLWFQPRYIFGGKWNGKKGAEAKEKFYCSEFVAYSHLFPEWWLYSPKKLFQECSKRNFYFYEYENTI